MSVSAASVAPRPLLTSISNKLIAVACSSSFMVCRVRWMYRAPAMSLMYVGARLLCHGVSPCVAVCFTKSMLAVKWYSELFDQNHGVLSTKARTMAPTR